MASTQQLKSRIRSVKSTKQITKAMQLVAASKMRRAQEADRAAAPYTQAARELLTYFSDQGKIERHPLFAKRDVKSRLYIVIASDKGLAGAYNSNVMKAYVRSLEADVKAGVSNQTITVGRRASQFAARLKDNSIVGVYNYLPETASTSELHAILETAHDAYVAGDVDAVDIIYTQFISSMSQKVITQRILPAGFEVTEVSNDIKNAVYEPSTSEVLDGVVYRLVGAQIFQAILDARASEWSMRMLAMKNATDNASDLVDDLTLAMNKARQGAITQELAEISGGVEALND